MSQSSVVNYDDFNCSVCRRIYDTPQRTVCGHVFCQNCLINSLRAASRCPVCRTGLNPRDFGICMDVVRKMAQSTIICSTCSQQIKVREFRAHEDTCGTSASGSRPVAQQNASNVIPPRVERLVYGGTFNCPYCSRQNFARDGLLKHCNKYHQNDPNQNRVCTICTEYAWGDPNLKSRNLIGHLNLRHRFDYDLVADLYTDDDASLKAAIEQSLKSANIRQ